MEEDYQEATLNIWYYLPKEIWAKVPQIYSKMPGWLDYAPEGELKGFPCWFSYNTNAKHVYSDVEPSGFKLIGRMEDKEWKSWIEEFKQQATIILGFKVGDIEEGEVDYTIEWLS